MLVYTLVAAINDTPCFIRVVCDKPITVWAPTTNCSLADSFVVVLFLPYGVTKYGSGWSLGGPFVDHSLHPNITL